MDNTNTKSEVMKPVLLKAGIPLAITVAGFLIAKLTNRTIPTSKSSSGIETDHATSSKVDSQENQEDEGTSCSDLFEEDIEQCSIDTPFQNPDAKLDKYEIQNSRSELQEKMESETKDLVLGLHKKLSLEIDRVELLEREFSTLAAERERLEKVGVECLKIVKLLANSRSENGLLRKRVKKLLKRIKHQSRVIQEQILEIEEKESEISRNHEELESGSELFRNMKVELEQMKMDIAQSQTEKSELFNQIEVANKTISAKVEEEEAIKADYARVVSQMEHSEKERVMGAKELIYLRWCNACLRHELMRRHEEHQEREGHDQTLRFGEISDSRSDDEIDYSRLGDAVRPHSKRGKIIQKLKKWMDGH